MSSLSKAFRSARHPEAVVGRELGGSSQIDPNLRSNLVDAEEEVGLTIHGAIHGAIHGGRFDVFREGSGDTKADPWRLDRAMGHDLRRLVLLQHKHRSEALKVSPKYFAQRRFANTLPWHNVQNVSHQTMHLVSLMIHLSSRGSFGPTEPGKVV